MTNSPTASEYAISALIVDDDPDMCWVLKVTLELSGFSTTIAKSGHEALRLAVQRRFRLAFIDARLPDMDGLQLATKLAHQLSMTKIIISGYYSAEDVSIVEAIRTKCIDGFFVKPFQVEAIEAVLSRCPVGVLPGSRIAVDQDHG
jgi:DNA-binding NtrC family response regulator